MREGRHGAEDLLRAAHEEGLRARLAAGLATSIVVRRDDVGPRVWPEVGDFGDRALAEVAWGDRDFYMAEPGTLWLALKAAFVPTGSVLHAVAFDTPVDRYLPETEVVELRRLRTRGASPPTPRRRGP